jgi:hypothetical protein
MVDSYFSFPKSELIRMSELFIAIRGAEILFGKVCTFVQTHRCLAIYEILPSCPAKERLCQYGKHVSPIVDLTFFLKIAGWLAGPMLQPQSNAGGPH